MAAIDPNAELDSDVPKRSTLKLIKVRAPEFDSDDEDDDFDVDDVAAIERRLGLTSEDDDDDEEESDDEKNGGPSDPEKTKKARAEALIKALKDDEEMDDLDLTNGINGIKSSKGKAKAVEDELDELDEDEDSEDEDIKEYVICTLDPEKVSHTNYVLHHHEHFVPKLTYFRTTNSRLTLPSTTRMRFATSERQVHTRSTSLATSASLSMLILRRKKTRILMRTSWISYQRDSRICPILKMRRMNLTT
jgi:hypothetical protein